MSDTRQKVRDVVLKQFVIDPQRLTDSTSLDDLGADSMAMVELMVNLEEAFQAPMPEVAMADLRTIGDIVAFIDANQQKQATPS